MTEQDRKELEAKLVLLGYERRIPGGTMRKAFHPDDYTTVTLTFSVGLPLPRCTLFVYTGQGRPATAANLVKPKGGVYTVDSLVAVALEAEEMHGGRAYG